MRKGMIWTAWDIAIVVIVLAILMIAIVFVLWPKIGQSIGTFGSLWGK